MDSPSGEGGHQPISRTKGKHRAEHIHVELHCFALPTVQTPTRDREQQMQEQLIAISHVVIAAQQSNPAPVLRLKD